MKYLVYKVNIWPKMKEHNEVSNMKKVYPQGHVNVLNITITICLLYFDISSILIEIIA